MSTTEPSSVVTEKRDEFKPESEAVESQPPPKRRRKTGWDVSEPPSTPSAPSSSSVASKMPTLVSPPVPSSSTLNPQQLIQQILAKPSIANVIGATSKPGCRIYIGSLHYDLKEEDIIKVFSAFGPVTRCDMSFEPTTGKSKGFCFLEFAEPMYAEAAMIMNGFEIGGRKIKVGKPTAGAVATNNMMVNQIPQMNLNFQPPLPPGIPPTSAIPTLSVPTPPTAPRPILSNFVTVSNIKNPIPTNEVQEIFSLHGTIKNVKKLAAMKLDPKEYYDLLIEYHEQAHASSAASITNGHILSGTALQVEVVSLQTAVDLMMKSVEQLTCKSLLLENMVTMEDVKDPTLKEEIALEAETHGKLISIEIIVVDKEKDIVHVKLEYDEPASASKAYKALGNRLFAGRKIKATLVA